MNEQFGEVDKQMGNVRSELDLLKEASVSHTKSITKLVTSKVEIVAFKEKTRELDITCDKLKNEIDASNEDRHNQHREMLSKLDTEAKRIESNMTRLDTKVRQDITNLEKRRKATTDHLDDIFQSRLKEVREVCAKMQQEKCDTFEMDEINSELTAELKQTQDSLQIVNSKVDVTKREFDDFVTSFQERVGKFEEEVGKRLVQAKLEFQLDNQKTEEGYLASTKMLNILQTELGDFIDENGRHVSLLQHDHQGIKEGIIMLDHDKGQIQKNMRHFVDEYQSYVDEMDTWTNDVTTKISNILQSMEPTKVLLAYIGLLLLLFTNW